MMRSLYSGVAGLKTHQTVLHRAAAGIPIFYLHSID